MELYHSKYFIWTGERSKIRGPIENFYRFLDDAYAQLSARFGINLDHKTPIAVKIANSDDCKGGIAGGSGPEGLGFCAGEWAENHWCYGLLAQELCNYFTGEGISGGWPQSWWANGRSPFPIMISVEIMKQLAKEKLAIQRHCYFLTDPWYVRFHNLHHLHGFPLWHALFTTLRELKVDLSKIEEPAKTALIMSIIAFMKASE